jgi:hypothetical protein
MKTVKNVLPYCNPTGLWTGIMFQDAPRYSSGVPGEVFVRRKDRERLRHLAERVAGLASRKREEEKRTLWYAHNALKTTRPVVLCDPENGWNEIVTGDLIRCEGDLARRWEVVLLKEIFWGESILDDRPIEPRFYVGYTYGEGGWGVDLDYIGGIDGGAYTWSTPVRELEDVAKLRYPSIEVDYKTTLYTYALAADVFDGILEVRMRQNWWWSFGFTVDLIRMIGLTQMMIYMIDKPDLIHLLMGFISGGFMKRCDWLEEQGLLYLNNDDSYIGSGAIGYCRDIPRRDVTGDNVRTVDMWGHCESQESVGVSPAMFEEFIYRYQLPVMERFGLNCYGCCEPVDARWHILKNIPKLRRLSVSAWADRAKMAEYLEDNYVYSWKPNPALLAVPHLDEDQARSYVRETLEAAKGCVLEIVMKDNHTIGNNPDNVINWVKVVRSEIDRAGG